MRSQRTVFTQALMVASFVAIASAARAQAVQDLQVIGNGTGDTNCLVTLSSGCTVSAQGTASATANGASIFSGTFAARADLGGPFSLNGWPGGSPQGICAPGAFGGTLTSPNGDSLTFNMAGHVCEEAGAGSPYAFNGSFRITSGTGAFAAAAGGGTVALTATRTDKATFLKMSGAISY
jgi:hypothetical protein